MCTKRRLTVGHVVVDDDVDTLNVDTTTEDVGGHHNPGLKVLELLVAGDAIGLGETSVDGDGGKVALHQQTVELLGPGD